MLTQETAKPNENISSVISTASNRATENSDLIKDRHKAVVNILYAANIIRKTQQTILQKEDLTEPQFNVLIVDEQFYSANFRMQKTRKLNIVPLLPEARAIIERYKNEPGDFALPRVKDSEINEAIKEIGRKAGITQQVAVDTFRGGEVETTYYEKWQLLSTKVGRKTFISCAASKGIPVHICAAVAGHSIKVCLKFYAGVADKERFVRVLNDMKLPASKQKKGGAGG